MLVLGTDRRAVSLSIMQITRWRRTDRKPEGQLRGYVGKLQQKTRLRGDRAGIQERGCEGRTEALGSLWGVGSRETEEPRTVWQFISSCSEGGTLLEDSLTSFSLN